MFCLTKFGPKLIYGYFLNAWISAKRWLAALIFNFASMSLALNSSPSMCIYNGSIPKINSPLQLLV